MEIYESIAWIAIGFIPTLLAMETASRLARRLKIHRRRETPLTVKGIGVDYR
ncbi:MAG TPA: hypothetical protein VFR94_08615 [Nitrososphaeraceae archaeon]|nr:hypothetical protein [Nitrososphaeraceae archaeon]